MSNLTSAQAISDKKKQDSIFENHLKAIAEGRPGVPNNGGASSSTTKPPSPEVPR